MGRTLVLGVALWLTWLPGCVGPQGAAHEPAGGARSADEPTASPEPAAPEADPCEAHRVAFRAAMASATGTCSTASDCGCFNPVVAEAGCGGITDRVTTQELAAIEARFHADRCPWPHQCAAWSCQPACVEGRCRNSTQGGRVIP